MQFWDNIINTALIGTDKKQLTVADLVNELTEGFEIINAETNIDKEEKFLQMASVAYNFRQSGANSIYKEGVTITEAPPEEKAYCNNCAITLLRDILEENSYSLLKLWLDECSKKNLITAPEMIPALLNIAISQKAMRSLIVQCCGNRAAWLSSFSADWKFSDKTTDEELWQTGTPEQRKLLLQQIRVNDSAGGRELLKQTWAEENANTKAELLKQLAVNISANDVEWIESLQSEKSQKVKDQALELLKQIPESTIVKQYTEILTQAVTIKKERSLMGFKSKISLHFHLPHIDENIFKSGIQKLSNTKEFTDEEYIFFQLIKSVPFSFWETHFSETPGNIIQYFQKDKDNKKFIPALVGSIVHFKDNRSAISLMEYSEVFYIDIIPLLPVQLQEHYSIKFFEHHEHSIIQYATLRENEWSVELAKIIFRYLAKNPYNYNRTFYNQYIHLIPATIAGELEKYTPPEDQFKTTWSNTSGYITKLLNLKLQIAKAFNK